MTIQINNINVYGRRTTSVDIYWDSTVPSTSVIEYGITISYGYSTIEDMLSYFHDHTIENLDGNTIYHYRIITHELNGNVTISDDYTFITRTQNELESIITTYRNDKELPKVYYMKPDGNDTLDGLTITNAWKTLIHAKDILDAGDILYILDGIYYNDSMIAQRSGIPEAHITIKAYSGTPTFIETGTVRTLRLLKFGAYRWTDPYPISYYDISGLKAINYWEMISPGNGSHHLTFKNITSETCKSTTYIRYSVHDISFDNWNISGGWWSGIEFYVDNYNIKLNNIHISNQNEHPYLDFHTNNRNITLNNIFIYGIPVSSGIYLHGDYAVNTNIVFNNLDVDFLTYSTSVFYINDGINLLVKNFNIRNFGTTGTAFAIEPQSGSGDNCSNWIFKDGIISNGMVGIQFVMNSLGHLNGIICDNITFNSMSVGDYWIKQSAGHVSNVDIINNKGDNNTVSVGYNGGAVPDGHFIYKYTNTKIFKSSILTDSGIVHTPTESKEQITTTTNRTYTYYPMSARPSSGQSSFKVTTSNTLLPNTNYNVKVNNIQTSIITTDDTGTALISLTPLINDIITVEDGTIIKNSITVTSTTGSDILFTFGESLELLICPIPICSINIT